MTKPKSCQHVSFPKFKLLFNLWLYMAWEGVGQSKLFNISYRHLFQYSMFRCMFASIS